MKKRKYWRSEDKDYVEAMQNLRRSSAASRHTMKKYKGTRRAQRMRSINQEW